MRRFLLTLLATPALLGSALCYLTVIPDAAQAADGMVQVSKDLACERAASPTQKQFVCRRVTNAQGQSPKQIIDLTNRPVLVPLDIDPNDPDVLEFTEEESDAAVALFGCDCPVCLNSLRQLRAI